LATGYFYTVSLVSLDPSRDHPLGTNRRELVRTRGGIPIDELSQHDERVAQSELHATSHTLRLQAEIARGAGRSQLADSLLRAAGGAAVDRSLPPGPDVASLEALGTVLRGIHRRHDA
jgi:propanediol dehydratase small subunit